jgi:hypothetical protein
MRYLAPLTVLLLAACSGSPGPDPTVLLERAAAAVAGTSDPATLHTLGIRFEGRLVPPKSVGAPLSLAGEYLLRIPDGLSSRISTGGRLTREAIAGNVGWLRQGAAVVDLTGEAARDTEADRDDLLAALAFPLAHPPFSVSRAAGRGGQTIRVERRGGEPFFLTFDAESGLPASVERTVGEAAPPLVHRFSGWLDRGGFLFPSRIESELGGGSREIEIREVHPNAGVPPTSFRRPDDSGPGKTGEIRRETAPAANMVMTVSRGPLTKLADVDLLLDRALAHARATKSGPLLRLFKQFPDADGNAVVLTMVAVEFSRASGELGLPEGMRVELFPKTDLLVMPYTGPYPGSDDLYAPLYAKAKELGLFPTSRPWDAILSDPDSGEPNGLRQEIRLPVKEDR